MIGKLLAHTARSLGPVGPGHDGQALAPSVQRLSGGILLGEAAGILLGDPWEGQIPIEQRRFHQEASGDDFHMSLARMRVNICSKSNSARRKEPCLRVWLNAMPLREGKFHSKTQLSDQKIPKDSL